MPATEPARHALYARLEDVIGPEHADTLMTYLPRSTGDEVATKADIADVKADIAEIKARFDRLEDRFETLAATMREQQRFYVGTVVASMTALTAAFSVVVAVFG